MPETTTQIVAPTVFQYEAFMAPPQEPLTSSQLFNYQVRCYADAGIATIEELERLRAHLPEDNKAFLVVSPKPQVATRTDLNALIAKLTYKSQQGVTYVDPQYLADEVVVPQNGYLMTAVDDGRAMLNVSHLDARVRLAEMHRSPFTWWEGYCLCLCFGFAILGRHNVGCTGSRCYSDYVPDFCLSDGEPVFDNNRDKYAYPEWGSASCGSRIGG